MVDTYRRALSDLSEVDFIEACDRIIFLDEWFPSIARIRVVTMECTQDRRERQRADEERRQMRELASSDPVLTCPICRGARWLRTGRNVTGDFEIEACAVCTTDGQHDARKESLYIAKHGGYPVPGTGRKQRVDVFAKLAKLAPFRGDDGRLDMDAFYRHSRELRGLDPHEDERPAQIAGFMTVGDAFGKQKRFGREDDR